MVTRRIPRTARAGSTASTTDNVDIAVKEPEVELTVDQKVDKQVEEMMAAGRRAETSQISMQEFKLFPHHVETEVQGIKKAISLLDFKQIIDQQLQVETKMLPLALPVNTLLIARSTAEMQISCYYPERRMTLKLQERGRDYGSSPVLREYKDVLLPNILITHTLKADAKNWMVTSTKYMCTNKKPSELPEDRFLKAPEGSGMWRVPLPNFYEDYRMCYGGNTMPVRYANNLRGLDYFYQVLSASPFNYDLGINVRDFDIPGWFDHLTKVKEFPYDKLISRAHW